MGTDQVTCSRLHQESVTQPGLTLIQSFSGSLQSPTPPSCCPLRCPRGPGSSFTHLFGEQMAERILLQTRLLEKSFLLDPKSQPWELMRINKSNKLLEAFPSNKKLLGRGATRHTQKQHRSHTCPTEKSRKKLRRIRQERPTVRRSERATVLASSRARQDWFNSLSMSRVLFVRAFSGE